MILTPNFTAKQNEAINTREKDILVSAGAGSGKTTVLTHRLIKRIKEGDSVTDFLVVTFMKAAASDIKRKLYDELVKEIAIDPENKHLYRQSLLVSEADICTISSYCLSLVKENFSVLGISPKVRVLDEIESAMMLRRVADELISKGYEEEDEAFLLLADNFTGDKNDNPLSDSMISLYNTLRVTLDRENMLLACADALRKEGQIIKERDYFATQSGKEVQARLKTIYDEFLLEARNIYDFAASVATDDKYLAPLANFAEDFDNIRNSLDIGYTEYCNCVEGSFGSVKLSSAGCDKESKEIIKSLKSELTEAHKKVKNRYVRGNKELNSESFFKTAEIVTAVNTFLNRLDAAYEQIKNEQGVLDYTDFEAKALLLLETCDGNGNRVPTELCLKKQKGLKEILIDEYQDVNPMQDRIFALLAGKSHRFMVGDVKQSIYRFRNAYPDIFLGYKERFSDIESGENCDNARIFLRENFRCAQTVIDFVNHLFASVTENTPYYREYDGEWLIHASTRPEYARPVVVAVADRQEGLAKEARRAEAEFIAREILRVKNNETADDGSDLKFSDFAVMLGAMKGYSIEYERAFRKFGVPYKTEVSQNFLENPDIQLAVSALKAIDDPTDDISLCSLMRSPICEFSSDDLYRIRTAIKDTTFWYAVCNFALPKPKRLADKKYSYRTAKRENSLSVRCRNFVLRLLAWRREASGMPCRDFIKGLLVSAGLLRISVSSGNRTSILLLYEYACKYESTQSFGLSGFLDYLSELSSSQKEIADAVSTGEEDAVSFITVHKSKGLEFKVCFLAGTEKEFRGAKNSSEITVLRGEGIYFPIRDRGLFTTFNPLCNINAVDKEREFARGEELRKLYVALTRAKERLYITGSAKIGWQDKRYSPSSAKSWLEMILYTAGLGEKAFFDIRSIAEAEGEMGYFAAKPQKMVKPTEKMLEIVNFKYPYASSVSTPKKISVSELRTGLLEDDEYNRSLLSVPVSRVSIKPAFIMEKQGDAADIGTANHLFMQFCDFKNIESAGVLAEAERLEKILMITPQQREMLDISALEKFFGGELYEKIASSPRVYREKRFSVKDILAESGEPVLVQGVIDCFFENPDGSFTVVDYKTDRVQLPQELINRHKLQLSCYCRAVERMTGRKVTSALLYSFALGCAVETI